jgi:hypothetical protein
MCVQKRDATRYLGKPHVAGRITDDYDLFECGEFCPGKKLAQDVLFTTGDLPTVSIHGKRGVINRKEAFERQHLHEELEVRRSSVRNKYLLRGSQELDGKVYFGQSGLAVGG